VKIKLSFSKDNRTNKIQKNIIASFFLKGGSMLISLLLVPLTLSYLNSYEYGVWLTLSSVLTWIYVLDIGLGNGLRNKLTEALALGDKRMAKTYVSTTFISLFLIISFVYILFILVQNWLNWSSILNVDPDKISNLNEVVTIVFAFFCINFVLKIVGNIFMAYQQPAVNDLIYFLGNLLSFVLIYISTKLFPGSLMKVAVIFSATPIFVLLCAYPIVFYKHRDIIPSIYFLKFKYLKDLMSLGFQFFIIQISCVIVFMTSNFIISKLFGPDQVTSYNIAFKYFSIVTIGFTIILAPIWSAVTDAYTRGDLEWIKKQIKKLLVIWGLFLLLTIVMILVSSFVYSFWMGKEIKISMSLSVLCGIYVTISNWNNVFAFFINGVGKVRLQLYSSILSGVLYIPLAVYLGKQIGVAGVILAMCLSLFISSIWFPVQYWKIVSNKAKGIWNK
jgi:O-antigen/teichoic acid export membrane protein